MKKIILCMLAVFILTSAAAQIEKKTWLVGASSSLGLNGYYFNSGSNLSVFTFTTKGGYAVVKNFVVGLDFGILKLSQSGNSETNTSIGAFARYYLSKNLFIGSGLRSVSTSESGTSPSSTSTVVPFEFGVVAFLTKNIAIEPSLNYVAGDSKGGVTYAGINTGANSSFGLNVGFSLYLNRD